MDLDTDALSFMGNVVVPIHIKGATNWRPYGTAGVGIIRALFDAADDQYETDQSNLAFNFGGGVMYSLTDLVGLRADLRYFRALVDEDQREGSFSQGLRFLTRDIGRYIRVPALIESPSSSGRRNEKARPIEVVSDLRVAPPGLEPGLS